MRVDPAIAALDDPLFYAGDPDAALARLRADDPVHWYAPGRFWALSRYDDVLAVSRDPRRFCSGRGVLMHDRERVVDPAESILYLDPPQHARYRKLVSRAFTPRRVAALEPCVRGLAAALLDGMDPRDPGDFVDAVAAPMPILVIADLLGIPAQDRDIFRRWSDAIVAAAMELTEENAAQALELLAYFQGALADRRTRPRDDLLTALVTAAVDGTRLSEAEQLGFCMTLLVAGNETTRSVISGGALALAEHPDQQARLAADLSLLPDAVEEMLRWVTPITTFARTATEGTVLGDRPIGAGDFVVLLYRSANRDQSAFGADADRFRIDRAPNPHLAFGFGEHFCLGAGLARLEARVLFEELLARWPSYRVCGPAERVPSTLFNQLGRLPLQMR